MAALARGQTSDCSNPELDLYTMVNSVRTDMYSVAFQVYEKVTNPGTPVQVYPAVPGDKQALNVADLCPTGHKLSTGHYVAEWTPELTEPIGAHLIQWYFKLTAVSPEQSFCEEFEVLPEATGATAIGYTTIQALRDEGVPDPPYSDAYLAAVIARASMLIDRYTGRWFSPRQLTLLFDGTGARSLHLEAPIIAIDSVDLFDHGVLLEDLAIYNRHITQNLTFPDDRDNPRIEIEQALHDEFRFALGLHVFPVGQQNIRVVGTFGYTDYDGTPFGRTPLLIEEACKLLCIRDLAPKFTADPTDEAFTAHRIIEMKTRDQSVKFANPSDLGAAGPGPFTGDRRIDDILLMYRAPPRLRSV